MGGDPYGLLYGSFCEGSGCVFVLFFCFFSGEAFFTKKSPEIIPNMTIYDKIYRAVFLKFACFDEFWIQQKLIFSL